MIYTLLWGLLWYLTGGPILAFFILLGLEVIRQFLTLVIAWAETAFAQK